MHLYHKLIVYILLKASYHVYEFLCCSILICHLHLISSFRLFCFCITLISYNYHATIRWVNNFHRPMPWFSWLVACFNVTSLFFLFLPFISCSVTISYYWVNTDHGNWCPFSIFECRGYVGIHSSGFRDFLLKPELLRAIVDSGFEHPSEGKLYLFSI